MVPTFISHDDAEVADCVATGEPCAAANPAGAGGFNVDDLTNEDIVYLVNKMAPKIAQHLIFTPTYVGDRARIHLGSYISLVNTTFDMTSGDITIDDYVFFGANATVVTGRPYLLAVDSERLNLSPCAGHDIHIERGVFVASNVTILGPCRIGRHAVIGAGSVVRGDVKAGWLYAGVPARPIREIIALNSDQEEALDK